MPDNFRIEFCLLIIDFIIDDFSQRFDKESMQLFHLASQFIRNPITFTLDSLLLLCKSFTINLAPLQDELIEFQAEHYELLIMIIYVFGAQYRNQLVNYSLLES